MVAKGITMHVSFHIVADNEKNNFLHTLFEHTTKKTNS